MYTLGKLAMQYEEQNFARYFPYNRRASVKQLDMSATNSKLPAKQLLDMLLPGML